MEETQLAGAARSGMGSTALARVQLRVHGADGPEEIVVERRWPDLDAARLWCERTIERAAPDTQVVEIQVFQESWWHARSWEQSRHRPVAEVLQLGMIDADGAVRWTEPRSMTPRVGAHLSL